MVGVEAGRLLVQRIDHEEARRHDLRRVTLPPREHNQSPTRRGGVNPTLREPDVADGAGAAILSRHAVATSAM